MDLATPDRPPWTEVVGVLVVCAVLFALITKLDRSAADRAIGRARSAQVQRAEPVKAPQRAERRTGTAIALPAGGVAEPAPLTQRPAANR